ncbi:hypothetical protein [Streptomyces sp. NBC_01565]|nr:hypothetical protein [Streptomyces sp. NBC_01565]MCX4545595.1 hypothetical protein [Streptomyces sp. NBC_01565]
MRACNAGGGRLGDGAGRAGTAGANGPFGTAASGRAGSAPHT